MASTPKQSDEIPTPISSSLLQQLPTDPPVDLGKLLDENRQAAAGQAFSGFLPDIVFSVANPALNIEQRFTVLLESAGARKSDVIRAIANITGLELHVAALFVDVPGVPVKVNVGREEAMTIRIGLESAGAKVMLQSWIEPRNEAGARQVGLGPTLGPVSYPSSKGSVLAYVVEPDVAMNPDVVLAADERELPDELTDADVEAIKLKVFELLKASQTDTPAEHLAYIRERLAGIGGSNVRS